MFQRRPADREPTRLAKLKLLLQKIIVALLHFFPSFFVSIFIFGSPKKKKKKTLQEAEAELGGRSAGLASWQKPLQATLAGR